MKLTDVKLVNQGRHLALYQAEYAISSTIDKTYEFVSRAGARDSGPGSSGILDVKTFPDQAVRGVIIMAFTPDKTKVLLMREFRPVINTTIFNHPMGLIDPGETPVSAGTREIKEETGLDVINVLRVAPPTYVAPGITDQKVATIVVTAGGKIKPSTNPIEITDPFWADRPTVRTLLNDPDNKFSLMTQASLYAWACA